MSAERLREAAALMRKRAKAATGGPWRAEPGSVGLRDRGNPWPSLYVAPAAGVLRFKVHTEPDAAHIASWHPAVALAVADWLEQAAAAADLGEDDNWPPQLAAIKAANAYLGGAA